jgi:hypothetical protein
MYISGSNQIGSHWGAPEADLVRGGRYCLIVEAMDEIALGKSLTQERAGNARPQRRSSSTTQRPLAEEGPPGRNGLPTISEQIGPHQHDLQVPQTSRLHSTSTRPRRSCKTKRHSTKMKSPTKWKVTAKWETVSRRKEWGRERRVC